MKLKPLCHVDLITKVSRSDALSKLKDELSAAKL